MIISAERLSIAELCMRRFMWTAKYPTRVSLMGALYRAVDAGLRSDSDPERAAENELMAIAANPGLDIYGVDTYSVAKHYSMLAGIISVALRSASTAPWTPFPDAVIGNPKYGEHGWRSACYDAGDGVPRRIVLVDRWSDDRKALESRNWRTLGEACALRKPILVTAVAIGSSHDKRRISPWTRCYRHPKNRMYRFKRTTSTEDFGATWTPVWREDSEVPTAKWLDRMRKDECMADAVQTVQIPIPVRWKDYVREIQRIALDITRWEERIGEHPPMRLAGCFGFSKCAFVGVCHGASAPSPEASGFVALKTLTSLA